MTSSTVPRHRYRSQKYCSIEGCENLYFGYCNKHHKRLWRHGDPQKIFINFGEGKTEAERFWNRVAITADIERCWEWLAGKSSGYGTVKFQGKVRPAHQVAWYLVKGKWSDSQLLRHYICDNPGCCNPHHLREGTHQDNSDDKLRNGRQARGEMMPAAKLTERDVREIRHLFSELYTATYIAKRFGISISTAIGVGDRLTWKHVKDAHE